MRTALLAAIKHDDTGRLRALLPLAGRSVLGWQIDFARAIGCERILCLCERNGPEILALQREVEKSGGEFHLVRSNSQLVALLRPGDQLLMMLDGLVPDPEQAITFGHKGARLETAILALPSDAEAALRAPEDFERIDAQRSWAGVALFDASTAAKLADYPADSEPMSLLLRLALQAGVRCEVPNDATSDTSEPLLADFSDKMKSRQESLLSGQGGGQEWSAPFVALSRQIAKHHILRERSFPTAAFLASAALILVLSVVFLLLGYGAVALCFVAIACFSAQCAISEASLISRLHPHREAPPWLKLVSPGIDLVAASSLAMALNPLDAPIERLALPVFAIGLARIAARGSGSSVGAFWTDRSLHMVGFAIAALAGVLPPALTVFGIGALSYKLLQAQTN